MIMNKIIFESSPNKYLKLWLSFVMLKFCNEEVKLKSREMERISLKIVNLSCHLSLNETCLDVYIFIRFLFKDSQVLCYKKFKNRDGDRTRIELGPIQYGFDSRPDENFFK